MLMFIGLIITTLSIGVADYVNDSVFMMFLLTLIFFMYDSLKMKPWIYFSIALAFLLHDLGMFGFYNISPVGLQWDHVTHFVGEFVAAVVIYNFFFAEKMLNGKLNKMERFNVLLFVMLAALGVGVFVEFMEFFGYFFVGEGMGIFAHGLGDINTEFINSEWFNTMFDLIYNFFGALAGVLICHFGFKGKLIKK